MKTDFEDMYKQITEERNEIFTELSDLRNDEKVKRFIELDKRDRYLFEKQYEIWKSMMLQRYEECHHLLFVSRIEHTCEGRSEHDHTCIKCGLRDDVLNKNYDWLDEREEIMYEALKGNHSNFINSRKANIVGDPDLVRSIYKKVKEHNPKVSDKKIIKYVEIALDNIRDIKVTDERKEKRAKRLELRPNFNKWKFNDVIEY